MEFGSANFVSVSVSHRLLLILCPPPSLSSCPRVATLQSSQCYPLLPVSPTPTHPSPSCHSPSLTLLPSPSCHSPLPHPATLPILPLPLPPTATLPILPHPLPPPATLLTLPLPLLSCHPSSQCYMYPSPPALTDISLPTLPTRSGNRLITFCQLSSLPHLLLRYLDCQSIPTTHLRKKQVIWMRSCDLQNNNHALLWPVILHLYGNSQGYRTVEVQPTVRIHLFLFQCQALSLYLHAWFGGL